MILHFFQNTTIFCDIEKNVSIDSYVNYTGVEILNNFTDDGELFFVDATLFYNFESNLNNDTLQIYTSSIVQLEVSRKNVFWCSDISSNFGDLNNTYSQSFYEYEIGSCISNYFNELEYHRIDAPQIAHEIRIHVVDPLVTNCDRLEYLIEPLNRVSSLNKIDLTGLNDLKSQLGVGINCDQYGAEPCIDEFQYKFHFFPTELKGLCHFKDFKIIVNDVIPLKNQEILIPFEVRMRIDSHKVSFLADEVINKRDYNPLFKKYANSHLYRDPHPTGLTECVLNGVLVGTRHHHHRYKVSPCPAYFSAYINIGFSGTNANIDTDDIVLTLDPNYEIEITLNQTIQDDVYALFGSDLITTRNSMSKVLCNLETFEIDLN